MHPLVGLVADLPVDARAVRDDLAALERSRERVDIARVDAGATRDDDGCLGPEPFGHMASDESGAAGDRGARVLGHVANLGWPRAVRRAIVPETHRPETST